MTSIPSADQQLQQAAARLTRSQQRIADHVLAHRFEAATLSIDALARQCGVSLASMNRFVRALGYSGYSAFREHWQQELRAGVPPLEKLRRQQSANPSPPQLLQAALAEGAEQLQAAASGIDAAQLRRVAKLLQEAPRVTVFGADVSAHLAGYFASYLSLFRGGVECLAGAGGPTEAFRRLLAPARGEVLVALSLPRYSVHTLQLCAFAREQRVKVIGLTDSPLSPLAAHADHLLTAPAQQAVLPASGIGMLGLLEGLCSMVAAASPRVQADLAALSQRLDAFHVDSSRR
ncbi:MAG: MurR/RpiR family transcriptional regulator [Pseudomonadota bacterium]